jgi:thiamine-monophosphate kinase
MFEDKRSLTSLSELGEFGLIDLLTRELETRHPETAKGVGDDAALLDPTPMQQVLTTDMLVEGVHFDLMYTPLRHLGYKAISVNVSDIAAMNATPRQVLVSLALSSKFTLEAVSELYAGILAACRNYKLDVVGGDTTTSKSGLVISITLIGQVAPGKAVLRSGAQPNDVLVVTGDLGGAYIGLQLLEREKAIFLENPKIQPDLEGHDYVLQRQLKPEARADIRPLLEALEVTPTSMIDVSDGLSSEVLHLCKQSKVGAVVYEEHLPIDPSTYERARELNLDPTTCALNGGEDYELLFTIPLEQHSRIKGNPHLTVIGHITPAEAGAHLVSKSGTQVALVAQGWNPIGKEEAPEEKD